MISTIDELRQASDDRLWELSHKNEYCACGTEETEEIRYCSESDDVCEQLCDLAAENYKADRGYWQAFLDLFTDWRKREFEHCEFSRHKEICAGCGK